jgi:hypothetical protein
LHDHDEERTWRHLDRCHERARRLFAATEALAIGWGGAAIVARATGIAPEHDRGREG